MVEGVFQDHAFPRLGEDLLTVELGTRLADTRGLCTCSSPSAATPGLGAAQTIDVAHGLPADALVCAAVRSEGFDIADANSALLR
jgi:hypothetical protein